MKLHSPQFETRLRRGARLAIRRSPELKQETRRVNRGFSKRYTGAVIIRTVATATVAFYAGAIVSSNEDAAAALAFVTLWTFFWVFFRAQSVRASLYQSSDLFALSFLPIDKPVLFRWELQKFYRASVMSLLDLIAGYGTIAVWLQSKSAMAAAVPVALLAWGMMLALAMFCGSRWPRFPYGLVWTVVVFSLIALAFGHVGAWLMHMFHQFATPINVLLPTGWASCVFLLFTGHPEWTLALLLIPIGAVLSTIPGSLARLQAHYLFTEATRPEVSDVLPDGVDEKDVTTKETGQSPLRVDSGAIEPIVREHLFSVMAPWHEPAWPEKILWRWLTPRERILAEFAFPRKIAFLALWLKCFRNAGITVLIALAVGLKSQGWESLILVVGLFLTYCRVAAQVLASGVAFQSVQNSGVNMPFYAGYGIGLRELSRLLLKFTAVQIPFLLLFSLLCGGLVAWFSSSPIAVGLMYGLKVAGLVIALRFVSMTFAFSSSTNDSTRFRLKSVFLVITIVALAGTFFVTAAGAIFVPNATAAWILWVLAMIDAPILLAVYSWFYNRKWFDLMNVPRR